MDRSKNTKIISLEKYSLKGKVKNEKTHVQKV
jgi:hypothetical protein